MATKAVELFSYRVRMLCGRWFVIIECGGEQYEFNSYREVKGFANELDKRGYVDGDK